MSSSSLISMIAILAVTMGGFLFLARMAMKKDQEKKK